MAKSEYYVFIVLEVLLTPQLPVLSLPYSALASLKVMAI